MVDTDSRSRDARRTTERILTAARAQFADRGYEKTTIRSVAAQAGIDPSMVMRYFGSKEGLFKAATEIDLRLPVLAGIPTDRLGHAVVSHFLDLWDPLGTEDSLMLLLRSALTNKLAAQRITDIFASQVRPFVSAIGGIPPKDAALRAGLIATQILGLALCRYGLELESVTAQSRPELIRWLGPVIGYYLRPESAAVILED